MQGHGAIEVGLGGAHADGDGGRIATDDTAATVAARLSVLRGPREQTRIITLDTLARLAAG